MAVRSGADGETLPLRQRDDLSGEFFARVSFKHTTGSASEDWREVVRQGMRLVHRAPADLSRFCAALRRLRQAQTSDKRLREALGLFPQLGDGHVGRIVRRYAEHEEPTLYGLLNAGTQVFWHNPKQTAADWCAQRGVRDGALRVRQRAAELVQARTRSGRRPPQGRGRGELHVAALLFVVRELHVCRRWFNRSAAVL